MWRIDCRRSNTEVGRPGRRQWEKSNDMLAAGRRVSVARPLLAHTLLLWQLEKVSHFLWWFWIADELYTECKGKRRVQNDSGSHCLTGWKMVESGVRFYVHFEDHEVFVWNGCTLIATENLVTFTTLTLAFPSALGTLCWCHGDNICEIFSQRVCFPSKPWLYGSSTQWVKDMLWVTGRKEPSQEWVSHHLALSFKIGLKKKS